MQLQEKLFANLELRMCWDWDWDWSPAHHAERTLSTDSETRRLHLPLEQTVGSSSTAALEDNGSFKCFCFCDGRNSYQRIDEAPQGRHWWDLSPCTDKDPRFEPNLGGGYCGLKAVKHIWPPGVKSASKRASIFKQGSPRPSGKG